MQLIEVFDIGGEPQQTCDARELWAFLGSKQDFSDWIKGRIAKYGFVEGQDYTIHKIMDRENQALGGWDTAIEYRLSLDMGKEIAMVEGNQKGREARRYFLTCEKLAKQRIADPNMAALEDPAILRQLLLTHAERTLALEAEVKVMTPKVDALDRIATKTEGSNTSRGPVSGAPDCRTPASPRRRRRGPFH